MLALLLATQMAVAPSAAATPRPTDSVVLPGSPPSIIRTVRALPSAACLGAGRMEASWEPSALYRNGDRPPKLYVRWSEYPDGRFCHAGATQ